MDHSIGRHCSRWLCLASLAAPAAAVAQLTLDGIDAARILPTPFLWATVANSATVIPGGDGRTFNSFNQPSVNVAGTVVLRARSKGAHGAGEPVRGIYSRHMATGGSLTRVFDTNTVVPAPNNSMHDGSPVTFTEFPSFPRIGLESMTIATRAQSQPVWTYAAPDLTETRVGTSGVYALRLGHAVSAATQLGAVPGFGHYGVPGAAPGTRFDQFPGSPAVVGTNFVVFKGNYTHGVAKTGIFFRQFNPSGMPANTEVIASSDTLIPGQPAGGVRFGSTAPPSASGSDAVFVGLDDEDAPSLGGIYRAPLVRTPTLQTLVSIGDPVPGEPPGSVFKRIGEGLSYDGQYIGFWASWGSAVRQITLFCPADGNLAAYCATQYPNGFVTEVPVNQGFFVHDLKTGRTSPVAKTGAGYVDFLYWVFSGRAPGTGGHGGEEEGDSEDFHPPRWRSAAFISAYGSKKGAQVAFKGRKQVAPPIDGIYLTQAAVSGSPLTRTLVQTGSRAQAVDPMAPYDATVISVGIEREGLRADWLAVAVGMLDPATKESWAGVYVTRTGNR